MTRARTSRSGGSTRSGTLETVHVLASSAYDVCIGPGALARVGESIEGASRVAIAADARVHDLHRERLVLAGAPVHLLPPGEACKRLGELERLLEFLAECPLDRASTLVAFGGGATGDLAGLAASLYMRGIAVVHCPTTLLAMVDAAVGGKTAVNLGAGKNLAGTIHQPRAVYADTLALATLPDGELRSGLGEVAKSALLDGEDALAALERDADKIAARDAGALAAAIVRCVRLKARFVEQDERERGPRKALNLGHTFAHAIEQVAGPGTVPHGVAVAVGLALALEVSRELGVLGAPELPGRVSALLARLGLPRSLGELRQSSGQALAADALVRAARLDKKGRAGEVRLVLLREPGDPIVDLRVLPTVLEKILDA